MKNSMFDNMIDALETITNEQQKYRDKERELKIHQQREKARKLAKEIGVFSLFSFVKELMSK